MKKMTLIVAVSLLFTLTASLCVGTLRCIGVGIALAEQEDYDSLLDGYVDQYIQSDSEHKATKKPGKDEAPRRYIYEASTVKNFSHMFWAVNLFELENDYAIDEFMRINECEIYRKFFSDEIEWKKIREATRDFIRDNKKDFPTRFEFLMPLKLGDYDEAKQAFTVQNAYRIDTLRRFELLAEDITQARCTDDHKLHLGYPRILIMEFSRPFNLTHVPVSQQEATDYMKRKMLIVNKRFQGSALTRARILFFRDAYLVLKIKVFAHGRLIRKGSEIPRLQMMGILEGFEIYETAGKKGLLFAQNYVATQSKGKLDDHLKTQYEILRRKHKGGGVFN